MPDAERYVTAEELRGELPFTAGDYPVQDEGQFNSALRRALDAASRRVEEWSGAVYATETTTRELTRSPTVAERDLPLPERPVQSVASVEVETEDGTTALAQDDDYRVRDTHLRSVAEPTTDIDEWPTERPTTVEWTYGFDGAPQPVREAIIRLARNALDQIETDGYESDADGWSYRPPRAVKEGCAGTVQNYSPPSYYSGAQVI